MSNMNGVNGHASDPPTVPSSLRVALIENVDVSVETFLGSAEMTIGALNALTPGATITLNTSLSSHVELRVNGVTVAHGELVAVGDLFGVRITSVAS